MPNFTGSDGTRDLLLQLYGDSLAAAATDVVDHVDADMSSEWPDDDEMWAATALGSLSSHPDLSCPLPVAAAAAPCPLGPPAQERAAVAPPSRAASIPTVVEQQGPVAACRNAQGPRGGSCTSIAIGIVGLMRRCGNSPLCLMGSHEHQQQQQQQRRQSSASSSSSWSHHRSTTTSSTTTTPPTATATTGDDGIPTTSSVDSVLSAAREAAGLARRLLDCPTCRAGPQLQLLLAVAFAEVIAGYRRVISSYHGGEGLKQHRHQHHHHRTNDELRRAPLSIGSHQIEDVMMEAALVSRVVGCRLQELEDVMGEILRPPSQAAPRAAVAAQPESGWWSGAEAAGGSSSSSSNFSVLQRGLHLGKDSFLATQLDTARHELTGLLPLHKATTADLLARP